MVAVIFRSSAPKFDAMQHFYYPMNDYLYRKQVIKHGRW